LPPPEIFDISPPPPIPPPKFEFKAGAFYGFEGGALAGSVFKGFAQIGSFHLLGS